MNDLGPLPFEKHDIFPNQVYKNIAVPPFCPSERYAALHTEAFTPRPDDKNDYSKPQSSNLIPTLEPA